MITNEVVAVFELVKNSYDADARMVQVTLENVSNPAIGQIIIKDSGNGMDKDTILKSWLELGTLSKARVGDEVRKSPGGRILLGEKGIGRLAVHKLGHRTELISRAAMAKAEIQLVIDWSDFETNKDVYLESIPVKWKERPPEVFIGTGDESHGTRITVTKLQTRWSKAKMEQLNRGIQAMTSPFAGLGDFVVDLEIEDPVKPDLKEGEVLGRLKDATYQFSVDVSKEGVITGTYQFSRPDFPHLTRKEQVTYQIRNPDQFPIDQQTRMPRIPECGHFKFKLYAWDLYDEDKEAVFGDPSIYDKVIKPNTGVRVFRDGFRVLPYGNTDDDWLSLDARRVRSFEQNISRNMVIGLVDVTSTENPGLRDKSDREGLIANQSFGDFRALVLGVVREFETYRADDRSQLKQLLKRTRERQIERIRSTLDKVNELISTMSASNSPETMLQVKALLDSAQDEIIDVIQEAEEPLLVAAAIGISYMIPTHEVRHDLQQIKSTLGKAVGSLPDGKMKTDLHQAWRLSFRADELVAGIAKVLQKGRMTTIQLDRVASDAVKLMNERIEEKGVKVRITTKPVVVRGSDRLLTTVLLNLIDNSLYWLQNNDINNRAIGVVVDTLSDGSPYFFVTDNGPGLGHSLSALVKPFVSHKAEGGMGLGLYIANQIAQNHGARLRTFSQEEAPGVLGGATIGIVFPEVTPNDGK